MDKSIYFRTGWFNDHLLTSAEIHEAQSKNHQRSSMSTDLARLLPSTLLRSTGANGGHLRPNLHKFCHFPCVCHELNIPCHFISSPYSCCVEHVSDVSGMPWSKTPERWESNWSRSFRWCRFVGVVDPPCFYQALEGGRRTTWHQHASALCYLAGAW